MTFYAQSTGGFYEEAIHGNRLLSIIEPGWIHPTILVPDPNWIAVEGEDPPLIEVADPEVIPPFIQIANPDCSIPADAVEITPEIHAAMLAAQTAGMRIEGDVDGRPVAIAPPAPTTAELKAAKLWDINAGCEAEIAAISASYPASEVLSWSKQEGEARAYTANASAATPLLDALATARGIDKADLAARVIAKADLFAVVSGSIIGKRQALEDQVNALPGDATAADLEAIQWQD